MSLIPTDTEYEFWFGVLERRCIAAAQTEEAYAAAARKAHAEAVAWVFGTARAKGSFLWACDRLDLNADALRRAVKQKVAARSLEELL